MNMRFKLNIVFCLLTLTVIKNIKTIKVYSFEEATHSDFLSYVTLTNIPEEERPDSLAKLHPVQPTGSVFESRCLSVDRPLPVAFLNHRDAVPLELEGFGLVRQVSRPVRTYHPLSIHPQYPIAMSLLLCPHRDNWSNGQAVMDAQRIRSVR